MLGPVQVRSSIAVRLGLEIGGLVSSDRNVDGVVDMVLEAIQHYQAPLSADRLFDWHYSLFPTGRRGMYKIKVGAFREDTTGPMQVVSEAFGKERVHFQAPPSEHLNKEIDQFLSWVNEESDLDPVLKAGIAHLWFITIHPFEDGNGRIARALTDMLLARSDGMPQRFFSMSTQIRKQRKGYYKILEEVQKGDLDITKWLIWFLNCLYKAVENSDVILSKVVKKHQFWNANAQVELNERQIKLLNHLLEGFKGKLTTGKWAKVTKCSTDTALRDIQDLIEKKILDKDPEAGGRSTSYRILEEYQMGYFKISHDGILN